MNEVPYQYSASVSKVLNTRAIAEIFLIKVTYKHRTPQKRIVAVEVFEGSPLEIINQIVGALTS